MIRTNSAAKTNLSLVILVASGAYVAARWVISFSLVDQTTPLGAYVGLLGTVILFTLCYRNPSRLIPLYGVFGASLFLFGHKPDVSQALIFEFLLATLILITLTTPRAAEFKFPATLILLMAFIFVSICSLVALPWEHISEFANSTTAIPLLTIIESSNSHSFFFSVKGVFRLTLFAVFVYVVTTRINALSLLDALVKGAVAGAVLSCVLGILDYYQIISLMDLRQLDPLVNKNGQTRLQSTFGHPGWFAEFVTVAIPYILYGFIRQKNQIIKYSLLLTLVICEVALILAQARSGWVAYPITLLFCWIFFYFLGGEKPASEVNKPKAIFVIFLSIPLTIAASVVIVLGANQLASNDEGAPSNQLVERAQNVLRVSDRTTPWIDGINVGRESLWTGMGYQSYRWHANTLTHIQDSYLRKTQNSRKRGNHYPTEHNFYVTTFVSVGIIGFGLWAALCLCTSWLLIKDSITNRKPENIPYLLSLISFHIYGFAQSMQYIPVVWFLAFLPFARAIAITSGQSSKSWMAIFPLIISACYLILSLPNFNSNQLRDKFAIDSYWEKSKYRISYYQDLGVFPPENWPQGKFTWTGMHAILKDRPQGLYKVQYHASHPELNSKPLIVKTTNMTAFETKQIVDRQGFHWLEIPIADNPIMISVSRTFQPSDNGSKDTRNLGIALGEFERQAALGVHSPEGEGPNAFRWTKKNAYIDRSLMRGDLLTLWVAHPDVTSHPVQATIYDNAGTILKTINFGSSVPQTLNLVDIGSTQIFRIEASRTWQPNTFNGQGDTRELGLGMRVSSIIP